MNAKIRRGMFETNSSSTHSITLSSGQIVHDKLHVNDANVCTIYTGEFGWEIKSYFDAATKASYALTYAMSASGDMRSHLLDMLREAIQMEYGYDIKVEFDINPNDNDWGTNGYIDHQSLDVCGDVYNSVRDLHRFIFDRNSVLYTDNDNH